MKKIAPLLLLLSTAASAAEIYKWTDEDGNVHYGDRPDGITDTTEVELVTVTSRRTNPERVQAGVAARQERDGARADARSEREAARQAADEARAAEEERAERCVASRARLEKYVVSRRLYRVGDDGEREYLDDSQIEEARAQAQQQVEEYCSS